jgi:hypothetical protein
MIDMALQKLESGHKIFMVSRNNAHAEEIKQELSKTLNVKDIFIISKGASLLLTPQEVKKGNVRDYKVVITTIRQSEDYTLTTLDTMIQSVYFSNNSTREQLYGRLNRPGQMAKELHYITFHVGLLTYTLENYQSAQNLSKVLKSLSLEI